MQFITDMIKGVLMGIANIIPGVSAGTMAVSFGIYNRLIHSVTNLFREMKKSLQTLIPIFIGVVIGIIGFTYAIEYLLTEQTMATCLTFVGLILGGLPILLQTLKEGIGRQGGKLTVPNILAFLLLFAFAIFLPMQQGSDNALSTLTPSFMNGVILFFVGLIASATMIVPGVSGSLVLMILGYYFGVINAVKDFLDALKAFDMPGLLNGFALLVPFGIGVIAGIFIIAKIIDYLFKKHNTSTYCAIIGLIIASPFAIFYNTGAFSTSFGVLDVGIGLVLGALGAAITYLLGKKHS